MKNLILFISATILILIFSSCESYNSTTLIDQVILKFGKDGQACYDENNQTYCFVTTSNPKKIISIGNSINPKSKLMICLQKSEELFNCQEVQPYHCHGPGSVDGCFCKGLNDCIRMAKKGCDQFGGGGHCDGCSEGDCCCGS